MIFILSKLLVIFIVDNEYLISIDFWTKTPYFILFLDDDFICKSIV